MNNDENIALIQRWWVWSKIGTFSCFCWMYKLVVSLESNLATSLQRLKNSSLFFVIPNAGIYCDEIFQDCTKIWITELFLIMQIWKNLNVHTISPWLDWERTQAFQREGRRGGWNSREEKELGWCQGCVRIQCMANLRLSRALSWRTWDMWRGKKGWGSEALMQLPVSLMDFPGGSGGKESACNAEDLSSVLGQEDSPGEGNDNSLQYSLTRENLRCRDFVLVICFFPVFFLFLC